MVIPKKCKRLAEVDFPLAVVSKHSAWEKSSRHGHPSTLHLWWARRPLASSRAVLLALLWPDPCDPLCPEGFKEKARELLPRVQGAVGPKDEDLRKALLKFIGDFANWDREVVRPSGTGFQPVNPWKHPELGLQARHLPHLQTPDATYFVTFRCAKGIELPENVRDVVLSSVTHWNGKKIDLDAAVVLPDHVHMIFRFMADPDRQDACPTLSQILHSIKSFSANEGNRLLERKGSLWLDESFDHIIRNGDEWEEKVEYIRQNAVKKGLAEKPECYKWLWLRTDRQDACPTVEFEIFGPKAEKDVPGGGMTGGLSPKNRVLLSKETRPPLDLVFQKTGQRLLPQ